MWTNDFSALFAQARCVACHTPQIRTGSKHPFAELRDQTIRPYSNLLLHDMGPGLADNLSEAAIIDAIRHGRTMVQLRGPADPIVDAARSDVEASTR